MLRDTHLGTWWVSQEKWGLKKKINKNLFIFNVVKCPLGEVFPKF